MKLLAIWSNIIFYMNLFSSFSSSPFNLHFPALSLYVYEAANNSGSVDWKNSADPFRLNKNGDLTCAVCVQVLELFFVSLHLSLSHSLIVGFSPSPRLLSIATASAVCKKKEKYFLWDGKRILLSVKKNTHENIYCVRIFYGWKKIYHFRIWIQENDAYRFYIFNKKNCSDRGKKSKNIIQLFLAEKLALFSSAFLCFVHNFTFFCVYILGCVYSYISL